MLPDKEVCQCCLKEWYQYHLEEIKSGNDYGKDWQDWAFQRTQLMGEGRCHYSGEYNVPSHCEYLTEHLVCQKGVK